MNTGGHKDGSRALATAAVLLGLGEFGSAVAERLRRERGTAANGDHMLGVVTAGGPHTHAHLDLAATEAVAERTLVVVREALAHTRMVSVRDANATEHHTRLLILVFANLGEPEVRAQLWAICQRVQERLLAELGPIFEAYRTGKQRNGVILPLLVMPHPPCSPDRPALVATVRELVASITSTPARRRAIPQLYLIEDVAEFSVLSEAELGQCVRNFATLLLYADLGSRGTDLIDEVLHGGQPSEPLATFVCAVAEFPRAKLLEYGRDRVALELLDAIRKAPRVDVSLSEADALEQIEARSFERGDEAEQDVREVLGRYAPEFSRDAPPSWWEPPGILRERYGPDPGDLSLTDPVEPAELPSGWLAARMREIEETWRLLQRKRFDDVVARDRAAVERWRDALLVRLRERVDRELWAEPSPQSLRRTEELVAKLRRAFAEQLDDAVRERDHAKPAPAPDFQALRSAHAQVLDAARRKPDPPRMLLWALLAWLALVLFAPPVLRMLADALRVGTEHWYEPMLREQAWVTALLLGGLSLAGWLAWVLGKAQLALLHALDRMWGALTDTIAGGRGSLLEYFTTRLRLARAIARVESLLAVQASLDADAECLLLIDKAARRARGELRDHLRELGVRLRPGERDDISGLLGRGGEGFLAASSPDGTLPSPPDGTLPSPPDGTLPSPPDGTLPSPPDGTLPSEALVEPFVGDDGAASIVDSLLLEGRESRIHDMLTRFAEYYGRGDRWREELPFADLERLRRAAAPHAEPIASWDPFAGEQRARDTATRIAGFVRRQRRSLRAALNLSAEFDATGIAYPFSQAGVAIVPRGALSLIREQAEADAELLALRPGNEDDRAYYVLTVSGISLSAVTSLGSLDSSSPGSPPVAGMAGMPGLPAVPGSSASPTITRERTP